MWGGRVYATECNGTQKPGASDPLEWKTQLVGSNRPVVVRCWEPGSGSGAENQAQVRGLRSGGWKPGSGPGAVIQAQVRGLGTRLRSRSWDPGSGSLQQQMSTKYISNSSPSLSFENVYVLKKQLTHGTIPLG